MIEIIDSTEFINTLNNGINEDNFTLIDFNDEIETIEYIGEKQTYDINVEGQDHFFYANDVLTHNSATGANLNITDVGNESISDSLGASMTADWICFILQTPEMKEQGLTTFKVTKNRFNGRTDYWDMNIDYNRMKFSDVIIEKDPNFSTASAVGMQEPEISTAIAEIKANDIKIINQKDNEIKEEFDVLAELGLS